MTRTNSKFCRAYISGYDMSGYAREWGACGYVLEATPDAALNDTFKNVIVGQSTLTMGTLNAFLNPIATGGGEIGFHELLSGGSGTRIVTYAYGVLAEPTQGDFCFMGAFEQKSYAGAGGQGPQYVTVDFDPSYSGATLYYSHLGRILHGKTAETAVNTAIGIDDYGAATTKGGYMVYHLFTSNGTVTLKVQDAATNLNASFADLSGATSGSINAAVTPAAGIVLLATTATVRQFLRWQLVFGTATTATFSLSFVRGL